MKQIFEERELKAQAVSTYLLRLCDCRKSFGSPTKVSGCRKVRVKSEVLFHECYEFEEKCEESATGMVKSAIDRGKEGRNGLGLEGS